MPLLLAADELPLCETASCVVEQIFLDNKVALYDVHHRHLLKCWLNKHFVPNHHQKCVALFEKTLCALIDSNKDETAKWHLRFVHGFQLLSECDSPIRCLFLATSLGFVQKIVDYFAFSIDKFIAETSNGACCYLEAKLLLKLVQTFSRIFGKIHRNNRSVVCVPARLINALWILAACDLYELDLRQASTNLIVQLDEFLSQQCRYNSFRERADDLIEKLVPQERLDNAKLSLQILGVGAFSSQLSPDQLAEKQQEQILLLVLLEDIASCSSSRMSTSMSIAFYRGLLNWTKAAVATCSSLSSTIWNDETVQYVFHLFVQLIESGWDSHAEVVRDLVSEVFETLLVFFKHTRHISLSNTFLEDLVSTLLRTDWQSRLKYRPLAQISELFGPDILFEGAQKVGINIAQKISLAFNDRAIAPHAATFIAAIVKSAACFSATAFFKEDEFLQQLIQHVVEAARKDDAVTRHFVTFVVPKLLKVRGKRFVDVIIQRASQNRREMAMQEADYLILFSVCRSARASGLYELTEDFGGETKVMLDESLNHSNIHIRLEAFGFLCENVRLAQPLYIWELDTIERFISASFKVDSSDFRQSYCSFARKFFNRLRDSGNAAERQQQNGDVIEEYVQFLGRITDLCLESVAFDGAAFARRSTALSLLTVMAKTFQPGASNWFVFLEKRPFANEILLKALIKDTYEDNKKMAFDLLVPFWRQNKEKGETVISDEALRLSRSTHPQNGVTAAYLFKLLATRQQSSLVSFLTTNLLLNLKQQIEVARKDLAEAAVSQPLYPTIICIRYVIAEFRQNLVELDQEFRQFAVELIEILYQVANIVSPIISHQSPEGLHQLNDDDDDEENSDDDENELLPEFLTVCCWRSIKEVSLTLSLLVELAIDEWSGGRGKLLEIDQIKSIGAFFSEMLLKARHRGAFEVAYAGFDHICAKLWRSQSLELNQLPSFWLRPLLNCFESTGDNVALSSTRRSAGLPFYFQAVVGNEPRLTRSVSVTLLETVLNLLIQRALVEDGVENVRVHALNILRALIRDSRLEQAVNQYLGSAFIAAIKALSSKNWSLRNSGTLLFSALMNRIFGVHRDKFTPASKNRMTGRLFFALYPNLFQFLLNFFDAKNNNTESLSSAAVTFLSLLEHLHPSPFDVVNGGENDDEQHVNLFAFIPALISLLKHRSIRVRIMSSRSIRNFVTVDSLPILLESLLNEASNNNDSNFFDGCFILLRKLVPMFAFDAEACQLIQDVSLTLINSSQKNDFLTASILHLLMKLVEINPELGQISTKLSRQVIENASEKTTTPSTVLIRAVQCLFLSGNGDEKWLLHRNKYVHSATVDCLNDILLTKFILSNQKNRVASLLFQNDKIPKDEEYVNFNGKNVTFENCDDKLVELVWQQLDGNFESQPKLLTLFSFCVLMSSGSSVIDEAIAEKLLSGGHFCGEVAIPAARALAAVTPFLGDKMKCRAVDIFSAMVTPGIGGDDEPKCRAALFGLSRLPSRCVIANDTACDVILTLLTSSEPEIRDLASCYVTECLCPSDIHLNDQSLHSGQALVIFTSLVVAGRPVSKAVEWLLTVATTPRRMMTTEGCSQLIVFEAEETNPFAEDRLLSNISTLLISILLNGLEKTLTEIFPHLRLPMPLLRCLEYLHFDEAKRRDINKPDLLLAMIGKKMQEVESATKKKMPANDAIYLRRLLRKLMPANNFDDDTNEKLLLGDINMETLLIC